MNEGLRGYRPTWNGLSYPLPTWILERWSHGVMSTAEASLRSAAIAILWARVAADSINRPSYPGDLGHEYLAGYHAYAGISACRTSIDYLAIWIFETYFPAAELRPVSRSVRNKGFRQLVREHCQHLDSLVLRFNLLAQKIDHPRQALQHNYVPGLVHVVGVSDSFDPSGAVWCLALEDNAELANAGTFKRQEIAGLLRGWAERLDELLAQVVAVDVAAKSQIDSKSDSNHGDT